MLKLRLLHFCHSEIDFAYMYLKMCSRKRKNYEYLSYGLSTFTTLCIAMISFLPAVIYGLLSVRDKQSGAHNDYTYYIVITSALTSAVAIINSFINFFSIRRKALLYKTRESAVRFEIISYHNLINGYSDNLQKSNYLIFKRINLIRGIDSYEEIERELKNANL